MEGDSDSVGKKENVKAKSSQGNSNYDGVESEASNDSFAANDRSSEAWSDEDCRLKKTTQSAEKLDKVESGNHLHVGRVSPSPRQL